ncbi:hypothetical protein HYS01_02765 [Candidatus Saccharibacteria bacterium]|nr:hypothetical protein [Candidatus Saccharibacteria bacterium]
MANKTIPLEDKSIVLQRLAEGMSTREAIQGTAMQSNSTASRLMRSESHVIAQKRRNYISLIEEYAENTNIERARLWGQMLGATKKIPAREPEDFYAETPGGRMYNGGYITLPDWNVRYKALVYLDKIEGIIPMQPVHVNLMQQVNKNG